MTKDQIADYLYFFWAPLLKAKAINEDELNDFQKMIILTLSQASVYVEAPGYIAGASSRDFAEDIIRETDELADKIAANIPVRTTEDSYWLQVTPQAYFAIDVIETHLEPEFSFGPYRTDETSFIGFHFYYLPYQLQIQLPTTAEISAILSAKKPFLIPDGNVTNLDLDSCSLWLSAIHFDAVAGNASLYTGMRLKRCNISFDGGYIKSGNKIAAGLFNNFAGFTIDCVPENENVAARLLQLPAVIQLRIRTNLHSASNTVPVCHSLQKFHLHILSHLQQLFLEVRSHQPLLTMLSPNGLLIKTYYPFHYRCRMMLFQPLKILHQFLISKGLAG